MTSADAPVLLLAPTDRDADFTRDLLGGAGIPHVVHRRLEDLVDAIDASTGTLVLSDTALASDHVGRLVEVLRNQESWSELPVVVLTDGGADSPLARRAVDTLGNVTLVERPVRVAVLVSVLRSALRARRRQQQIRDQLAELARLNRKLERLAFYDTLTQLPNRALLRDRLTQAMARVRRHGGACAVLFLDFDDFKILNDSLGHDMGDRALTVIAGRLRDTLRDDDTAARQGGDEFVMVLTDLRSAEDAATAAAKVLRSVARPFQLNGHEVRLTTSMGIAPYTGGDETAESLLKQADLAMYHAKEEGKRGFQFFTDDLQRRVTERLTVERDLRTALERRELTLHYQPRVRLRDGAVVGVEALVRWNHPTRGLLGPDAFVPVAEEAGLVWDLGRQVLDVACRQARAWHDAGHGAVRVAVNLSVRQLQHAGLVRTVEAVLADSGLRPEMLELEVTESATMDHLETVLPKLRGLKELGVRLAIDDFGTGYSSLEYLQRLPIDAIKIDRGFLRGEDDPTLQRHNEAIVRAIVALGSNLGIGLVGEGIETEAQRRFLTELGCQDGQGYLFGAAAPAEDVAASLPRDVPVHPSRAG